MKNKKKNNRKNKFTEKDALYPEAKKLAQKKKNLTIADIQKNLKTGFVRSSGLMDMLKEDGVIKEVIQKPPSSAKLKRIYRDVDWGKFKNKPVIPLGADTPTNNLVGNLENLFSLFVIGKNNSEREMLINSSIANLLKNTNPEDFRLIIIDTKKSNSKVFKNLPNLYYPIINDEEEARKVMSWCVAEVDRRFNFMIGRAGGFIEEYNKKFKKYKSPRILIVINDYADLTKKYAKHMKKALHSINVFGMLYGIHLLVCSSKLIKDICPPRFEKAYYRVAFKTNTSEESKLAVGTDEAKKLKGKGDALLKFPSDKQIKTIQCFTISKDELKQAEIKCIKYQKSETYYSDLYDRMTVEDCRGFEKRFLERDLPKYKGKVIPEENQESFRNVIVSIPLYVKKGQHYEQKSETIRKWQQRDKEKDETLENAKAPDGVRCLKCGKEMTCTMKELHDYDSAEEQVLFTFRCYDCNKIRMIYESGREFVPKSTLCPKCRTEMTVRSSRRNQVVESVYDCPKCEHQEVFTVDLSEKEPEIDKDFEADRKRFCMTEKEGMDYITGKMNLERVDELMKKK